MDGLSVSCISSPVATSITQTSPTWLESPAAVRVKTSILPSGDQWAQHSRQSGSAVNWRTSGSPGPSICVTSERCECPSMPLRNTIAPPSGDHSGSLGLIWTRASSRYPVPSGLTIATPSPSWKAIRSPSGDQHGLPALISSPASSLRGMGSWSGCSMSA